MATIQCKRTSESVEYTIETGFDAERIKNIQATWGAEKVDILSGIIKAYPDARKDGNKFMQKLQEYKAEDFHWDWIMKAALRGSDEYSWFYLVAQEKVQAVLVIYHPKPSKLDGENIFYVDYVATAFWNRDYPGNVKQFSGLATLLLMHSVSYFVNVKKYRPGFSLHSLPGAEAFCRKIGMTDYGPDSAYQNLRYFEAEEKAARAFAGMAA